MEETKKSRNDQGGNKKMVIKMGGGGGGGGGIGAVVLLGGALATAAFASAFVLGQKRKDRRQKSEKDEAKKGQEIIPRDQIFYEPEHIRKEEKEEVEVEKDSTIKISEDEFVIVKEEIPLLDQEEKVESIKEEISDHQCKVKTNVEQVSNEDKSAERESDCEIDTKDGGVIEVIRADIDGVEGEENVKMNEIGEFCNGNGEIINEEKCVEPKASEIVFSEKTLLPTDSVQIVSKSEEDKVEEKTAINGCILHLTMLSVVSEEVRENAQVINHVEEDKTSMEFGAMQNVEEDQISPEEVEVVKYVSNENLEQHENEAENKDDSEEELIVREMSNMVNGEVLRNEESNEVIETKSLVHTCAKTNRMKIMMDYGGDRNKGLNESEENSKWEAQWQGECPKVSSKETKEAKGMSYEVGGKIQEDYSAPKSTFTNKDEVMMTKDQYPTRWRVMIWTLSVLSSLSCSWFFDLSSAKLCLVVFLTVFLLEIYGYPLLNRKQAHCLHAAKGESIYEQRSLKK